MLTKLTLGEKLKDLRLAKGYKSTEQLASVVNIPKTGMSTLLEQILAEHINHCTEY